jgi:hypothetical protein
MLVFLKNLQPRVIVSMDTGDDGGQKTILSDDEAVELFNKIVNKIRPRPVNGQAPPVW